MTPDERRMLEDLADKFSKTPAPPKDPESEDFIRTRIGSRPDALYLMTQTVLIQNLALQQAQQQLRELQQRGGQPPQVAGAGSFLGGQQSPPRGTYAGQQQTAPPQYAPSPQYAPMPSPGSGAPSFLKGAAQTAAGVAAGALAFEGIQALFSHPGYGGGPGLFGGGGFGGGYGGAPVDETVVNNYYDDDRGRDDYRAGDQVNYDAQNADDPGQYDDAGNYDDSGNYDTGDGGGFDDGGGGDNFV